MAFLIPEWLARQYMPEWAPVEYSFFVPDEMSGWRHPPSTRLSYKEAFFNTNHYGLRDVEPGTKTKPRILFLGDSFTWGWGIEDHERYTSLLQQKFPHHQLINAGITGYGTLQELYLLQALQADIKPDRVVLQLYNNDFEDNLEINGVYPHPYLDWQHAFALKNHPVEPKPWYRQLLDYLANETWFYRQLLHHLFGLMMKLPITWHEYTPEPDEMAKQEGMKLSLKMFYAYCDEMHMPVTVFVHGLSVEREHIVREVSLQHGSSVYVLDDAFKNASERVDLGDAHAHWNAYGNKLVAEFMYPLLGGM